MKFIQIQDMFLLIELAERIFLDADGVFRGLPPEGWYLPEWIGETRSSVFLCLVIALYAGDYLICRTGGGRLGKTFCESTVSYGRCFSIFRICSTAVRWI